MAYVELVAGLAILVFAGDALVKGSVSIAQRLGVPAVIIGLTLVAFGTSAPELVVSIDAVLSHAPSLAVGNVVGSNIANILLVLGIPAIISPIVCDAPRLGRNIAFMIGASLIVIGISLTGHIGWMSGLMLTGLLVAFLYYSATTARNPKDKAITQHTLQELHLSTADVSFAGSELPPELEELSPELDGEQISYLKAGLFTLAGLIGLIVGADLLVDGAVDIARGLGVSEAIIGLTLVAIGTSLPELVTGIAAAMHKHSDVAMGNVIGSNLFNLLGILGISSLVGDLPVPDEFIRSDLWVMLAAALLLVPAYVFKRPIGKLSGIIMLLLYTLYMVNLSGSFF